MEVKKYEFALGRFGTILDHDGHEQRMRTADDKDVDQMLDDKGEISVSDHIMALVDQEQDRFQKMSYTEALERVRKKNVHLFRLYASESGGRLRVY